MNTRFFVSRFLLVAIGVALGFAARFILGAPESAPDRNKFHDPVTIEDAIAIEAREEMLDLPILEGGVDSFDNSVPPIELPAHSLDRPFEFAENLIETLDVAHVHGESAVFEPHGEGACASGCAASRHPTQTLTQDHYLNLVSLYAAEPMDQTGNALEELLYFGRQTRAMIAAHGLEGIDSERRDFLVNQLNATHANIQIRVVDEAGDIRTWLPRTSVPFDRRHVFDMKTDRLQPLLTSGTVKRTGLNHIWIRL